ncbi:MAG: hypothetical protein IT573_11475 [Deltaproteobacteria bacterium]|nr:hypothetical protein [Deltaproteobacteria bacterium]
MSTDRKASFLRGDTKEIVYKLIADQTGEARLKTPDGGSVDAAFLVNENGSAWVANVGEDPGDPQIIRKKSMQKYYLRPSETQLLEDGDMLSFSDKCFQIKIEGREVLVSYTKLK